MHPYLDLAIALDKVLQIYPNYVSHNQDPAVDTFISTHLPCFDYKMRATSKINNKLLDKLHLYLKFSLPSNTCALVKSKMTLNLSGLEYYDNVPLDELLFDRLVKFKVSVIFDKYDGVKPVKFMMRNNDSRLWLSNPDELPLTPYEVSLVASMLTPMAEEIDREDRITLLTDHYVLIRQLLNYTANRFDAGN